MIDVQRTPVFIKWLRELRDTRAVTRIANRLDRLRDGYFGDVSSVDEGVSELRIHYGPGYRVYFKRTGDIVILLLCGGDKATQARDIDLAKTIARELKHDH